MNRWLTGATRGIEFIQSRNDPTSGLWQIDEGPEEHSPIVITSFYHGAAGVLHFLVEYYLLTQRADILATAVKKGDQLWARIEREAWLPVNMSAGWASHFHIMHWLAEVSGEARFAARASECTRRIRAQATKIGTGVGWIEPIPYSELTGISGEAEIVDLSIGAAGALLALIESHRLGYDPQALEIAIQAADRLIEVAEVTPRGLCWQMMHPMPFPFPAPNFAHGSAGVGFALARLAQFNGASKYLDAAIAAANYAGSCETPRSNGGALICHLEGAHPPTFYLGNCHGPPGTARLYLLLNELTNEPRWATYARRLMNGLDSTGAPEQRQPGLWNNYGQCCGDAGIGDFALLIGQSGIWDEGIDMADRCARVIFAHRKEGPDGWQWPQAERRAQPDHVRAQTGYMQGAAGIGSFLLHVGSYVDGKEVRIPTLDWPSLSYQRKGEIIG